MASLKKAALGAAVLSASNVVKVLLQLALVPILARLLRPADFGLVGLAMPVVLVANFLSDFGIGNAIIRAQKENPRLLSTVFWSSVLLGAVVTLAFVAGAPQIAAALNHPQLTPILMALAPILVLGGASAAPIARLIREQRYGAFAASDVACAIAAGIVALMAALTGWGAWALVAQQTAYWSVRLIWLLAASRLPLGAGFNFTLLDGSWSFGANVTGSNILDFAASNLDNVIVGVVLGAATLGQYIMAYQFIRAPILALTSPLTFSLYPLLARIGPERARFRALVLDGIKTITIVIAPLFAGIACIAGLIVSLLLPPPWAPVAHLLPWLAPVGAVFALSEYAGYALMAAGRADLRLRASTIRTLASLAGVGLGAIWFGLHGAAVGLCASLLVSVRAYVLYLARELDVSPLEVLAQGRGAVVSATPMVIAVLITEAALHNASPLAQLALTIGAGALVYLGLVWLQFGAGALDRVRDLFVAPAAEADSV